MRMGTTEKIKLLARKKGMNLGNIAQGTKQTRQNLCNKMRRNNFSEAELKRIANALGCDLRISFVDRETKEEL